MDAKLIIEENQRKRFLLLSAICTKSKGDETEIYESDEICQELGIDSSEARILTQYLVGEGLLKNRHNYVTVSITHRGIVEIEQKILNPEISTDHFTINVANIIQTGGINIFSNQDTNVDGDITGRDSKKT